MSHEPIPRVKEAFDRIYREEGYVPSSNLKSDPNSKPLLEQESRKRALAHLDLHDRIVIESCIDRLKECCPGVALGDSAALMILEHIGIFLSETGYE